MFDWIKLVWLLGRSKKCYCHSINARKYVLVLSVTKTIRVVKTCPPCVFDNLEDRQCYDNHVIDLGKWLCDATNDVATP